MDNPILNMMKGSSQDSSNINTGSQNPILDMMQPESVTNAQKYLGSQSFNGYCQTFAEKVTGQGIQGGSAAEAWNNSLDHAHTGLDGAKRGDLVYFAPDASNEGNGHVGVFMGNNKIIAATDNGVQSDDINSWQKRTGQRVLGYLSQTSKN